MQKPHCNADLQHRICDTSSIDDTVAGIIHYSGQVDDGGGGGWAYKCYPFALAAAYASEEGMCNLCIIMLCYNVSSFWQIIKC